MPLTPLVFVFKHGMIGFLTKLRGQGGAKLLQMLLNIGKAITSPGFIGAYLKGIIKGFFVDGLWGTITFLWEIVKLPFTIGKFIFNLAKYLSSPEWIKKVVAITKAIQETGTWLKENGTSMIQDLQKEAGGGGGIQLGAIFNALVSSAAGWVQKGGEKMADQMIAFFSQSPDKLGPALGNTVGTVVGMVLFEVVLSAVTFGGGSAVTATKTALRPIFKLLGEVGAGALKAITTIAAKLRKWISGAAKALLSYISRISRKIGSKVEGLFGNLRKWVTELEGVKKHGKTTIPAKGKSSVSDSEFLESTSELFRNTKISKKDGGIVFKRKELRRIIKELEKKYSNYNLKVEIVGNKPKHKARMKEWNRKNTRGSFLAGDSPKIYLRKNSTELTLTHELLHFEDFRRLGFDEYKKIPNWKHEESVWEKIFASKERWTKQELVDSYLYYKETALREGGIPKIIPEMEKMLNNF